jgi:hypothetical protein
LPFLAAQVVQLVGLKAARRTPLSRALVRNLVYHDVLSSSSSKEGLLLDYSSFSSSADGNGTPATVSDGTTPVEMDDGEEDDEDLDETEEELLDTLMGCSQSTFVCPFSLFLLADLLFPQRFSSSSASAPTSQGRSILPSWMLAKEMSRSALFSGGSRSCESSWRRRGRGWTVSSLVRFNPFSSLFVVTHALDHRTPRAGTSSVFP